MKLKCIDCGKELERIRRKTPVCFNCQRKRYIRKKPEIIKRIARDFYQRHKDEISKKAKEYYFKKRDEKIIYARKQRKLKKEEINNHRRELYISKNREKIISQNKRYYQKNKDKIQKKGETYRKNNKNKILLRNRNRKGRIRTLSKIGDITTDWLRKKLEETAICPLCSKKIYETEKHIDHIVPINIGGEHKKNNVRVVCKKCNLERPKDGRDLIIKNGKKIKW